MKEIKSIGFHLIAIKTEQFAVFEENLKNENDLDLNTNFEFKLNTELMRIGVFATFQFENNQKAFIKLQVSCHFEIEADAWNGFKQPNEMRFPATFARHLCMLTVGTARGILHCKTEGTSFNSFLMPTINVAEVVVEDVVFAD